MMENRRRRLTFLARYARQSLLGWDNIEVNEIRWWYDDLYKLMQSEGSLQKASEDGS